MLKIGRFSSFSVALLLGWSTQVGAQSFEVNLNLEGVADGASETVTVNLPDVSEVQIIRLSAYDPDFNDEGQLTINNSVTISLFPGADGGFDGQLRDIDLRLNAAQRNALRTGQNTFRFTKTRTNGFRIEGISVIGEISTRQYASVKPAMSGSVDANRTRALQIYKRLVGVRTGIDNPKIVQMANHLAAGNAIEAAQVATTEPGFYNLVVRDFGAKMATVDETPAAPLSDLVATVIGVTRDETDARELLTGRFFYMGNNSTPVPRSLMNDVVKTNRHYETLESDGYDLATVLTRVPTQYLRGPNDTLQEATDAAGVLTSRAFMESHATAGTNRRLVKYTMQVFACNELNNWADAKSPDIRVGRDVNRFPGGDAADFQTTCKACHGNMDGFRGAFAKFDFEDGFTKYASFYPNGNGQNAMNQSPIGVASKMNRNEEVFPAGFEMMNDSWKNYARSPANDRLFGWRGNVNEGSGVRSLGVAVANSKSFSRCMVKRVFNELCGRQISGFELPLVDSLADRFEADGYKLKGIFERVSVRPECMGQ